MAQILKGAEVVKALNEQIVADSKALKERGVEPTLAVVRVGQRGDDISYENGAIKRAQELGVAVRSVVLPDNSTTALLVETLEDLNANPGVHGVLMFRPLPKHIDEDLVRNTLVPQKDIDGITDLSLAGVFANTATGFAPCTAQACMEILRHYGFELRGRKAVVVGRSLVIGKPVAMLLLAEHATVTLAHSQTVDLPEVVSEADLVIACVGRAQMINADYLAPGQVVIDVGINVSEDGALVGDVATQEAEAIVEAVTPVPGGVGTVTTSVLFKHVVQAATRLPGA
ncbi:MAG: bifunctional 5,10-methylenetetrahydrofolate dehydrogenase/5,10-methenyltetrahydrofolate cyclohydrolase [Coriobacteriales bacterium]|nr:bifunctional 5,10-methylenetetrahydrofolate dehydrogenase/5,10-methenyltetrahydrofolate cyclohydrolase [Coriobacteriales bacterium]